MLTIPWGFTLKNYLLFPLLFFISLLSEGCRTANTHHVISVERGINKDSKTPSGSPRIEISEYPAPDYTAIQSISIISQNEIYSFTLKAVYLFSESKFKLLYKTAAPLRISAADCNGKYIALITNDYHNLLPDFKFIILELRKGASGITISKKIECKIPFTHTPGMLKFIGHNILFIAAVMEYGFLDLDSLLKGKKIITDERNFRHYALPLSSNDAMCLKEGFSNQGGVYPFFITDKIYYLQNHGFNTTLKLLCKIPVDKKFNSYNSVQEASIADTNFGCLKFYDYSPYLFFSRNKQGKLNYFFVDSLKLTSGGSIPLDHVQRIITFSVDNIWCFTKEGEIFHNISSGKTSFKTTWEKIGALSNVSNFLASACDSNNIYLFGDYLTEIKVSPPKKFFNNFKEDESNKGNLFELQAIDQVSQNYGAGVLDVNNDNREDLYLVELESDNKFFINPGPYSSSFNLLSIENNIANQHGAAGRNNIRNYYSKMHNYEVGVAVGDFDNSGSEDIYLTTLEGNSILLKNNGSGYFRDATDDFDLNKDIGRSEGAVLADVNNDGYLDIFTTSFLKSNSLFVNDKGVKFFDATKKANLNSSGASICAAFADINNDGYPDLYVGNWMRSNKLYLNNGNGTYKDITALSGTGLGDFHKTNSVMFADFNNDGLLDLFVGNRGTPNKLFLNLGGCRFKDVSAEVGLTDTLYSYGAAFGDFDNDGYLDLFVNYLGGIKIYKNMMGLNSGKLYFKDMTESYTGDRIEFKGYNTAAVTLDYDNDGDIDIFNAQYEGKSMLLKNLLNNSSGDKSNFLEVKLTGSESNRDAIGAKLKLFRNDTLIAYREVESGDGYASSSSKIQHFGISDGKANYKLQVIFPKSGIIKNIVVQPGTFITVHEHDGTVEDYYFAKEKFIKYLFGKQFLDDIVLLAILIVLIVIIINLKPFAAIIIKNEKRKKLKTALSIVLFFAVIFFLSKFIFTYTQSFYLKTYYYISNTRNIFLEDILPYIVTISVLMITLRIKRSRSMSSFNAKTIIQNLFYL